MPGVTLEQNSFVATRSVVTKNVEEYNLVVGSPARVYCDIRKIKGTRDERLNPWKEFLLNNIRYPWKN